MATYFEAAPSRLLMLFTEVTLAVLSIVQRVQITNTELQFAPYLRELELELQGRKESIFPRKSAAAI